MVTYVDMAPSNVLYVILYRPQFHAYIVTVQISIIMAF